MGELCIICGASFQCVHLLADRIAKLEADFATLLDPCAPRDMRPVAAGPIPRGYELAPGWTTDVVGRNCYGRGSKCYPVCGSWHGDVKDAKYLCDDSSTEGGPFAACDDCAVEMGAIVPSVEPPAEPTRESILSAVKARIRTCYAVTPTQIMVTGAWTGAPAQGAPAEPLSARMQAARDSAVFERANAEMRRLLNCFIGEVMTLEAQLSSERERCAGIAEWWLLGNGKQGELVDAIRDGRPAPK